MMPSIFRRASVSDYARLTASLVLLLGVTATSQAATSPPLAPPQRLSDWLLAQKIGPDDYPFGLVWKVPGEVPAQTKNRAKLLKALSGANDGAHLIHDWIAAMPVTGRVPVAVSDASWLQVHPAQDPVIREGQTIILPKRPDTVTLMISSGKECQLAYEPGWMALDYLMQCDRTAIGSADWAWIVQPDGKYRKFGIAAWNRQEQTGPAPGAWIWVPLRRNQWAVELSEPVAQVLATQGIAPETTPLASAATSSPPFTPAMDREDYYRGGIVTANDWGEAGLLQTPTARMREEGTFSFTATRVNPYNRTNVFLQPLSWLEFGFRYSSIGNRLYDPNYAGGQIYKDKSADMKLALLQESAYVPQVAVGFRDFIGTGLFSAEYFVANKRLGAFDTSLGIGWGYLGSRQNMGNPFSVFGQSFNSRPPATAGSTGEFNYRQYFHGRAALFGGVQYHTPWDPLVLKLEYDGNNYQQEPLGNQFPQSSPWNAGAVYRLGEVAELTVGYERGNTLMVGLTFQENFAHLSTPKLDDPPIPPAYSEIPQQSEISASTASYLTAATNWRVNSITQNENTVHASFDNVEQVYWNERTQRAIGILNRFSPPNISTFEFDYHEHSMGLATQRVDRAAWVTQHTQLVPPSSRPDPVTTRNSSAIQPEDKNAMSLYQAQPDAVRFTPGLDLNYSLGGPNSFMLYEVAAEEEGQWNINDSTWLQGNIEYNLFNNYGNYTFDGFSNLPRVRTYIREYLLTSRLTMPTLQLSHAGKLDDNQYYSLYGGYLEMMFGGIGGEWLYRPFGSPLALGVDVNRVRQRDFSQNFVFRKYQVTTGHLTLYWETPWNGILATLSAGRYLAGDVGGTIQLERVFRNGVSMGGFVTKTNVSPQQYGEGSFNKGIFVHVPLDVLSTRSNSSIVHFTWQPLIRDGGEMLDRQVQLYDMTRVLDQRAIEYAPAQAEENTSW